VLRAVVVEAGVVWDGFCFVCSYYLPELVSKFTLSFIWLDELSMLGIVLSENPPRNARVDKVSFQELV